MPIENSVALPAVAAKDVTYIYRSANHSLEVLKEVSFTIGSGEFVSLVGPSGCGKTTLLKLVGCIKSMQSGSLKVLGDELNNCSQATLVHTRSKVGFVFQTHHLMEFLTAAQNIQIAMESRVTMSYSDRLRRSTELLATLGLESKANNYPSMLSGGQKQRVSCARAIACDPLLLLADEPTASLDRSTGQQLILGMKKIAHERQISMLMATHDPRVMDMADRLIHIDDGRIIQ
jgi:putative ABC transport system ATP-binding protein